MQCLRVHLRKPLQRWQLLRSGLRRFETTICTANILDSLKERGLVAQVSQPESALVQKLISGEKLGLYCGADPTARSLHLGNLLPLMVMLHFYLAGHDVFTLVGGATGKVGDPSGRSTERSAMEESQRLDNVAQIQGQLRAFFDSGLAYYRHKVGKTSSGRTTHTNNFDWWHDMKMLDFLAMYGKHIRVQSMLSRDSVSSRLNGQDGIGFNEFTYQILQAYDFYHLNKTHGVTIQVGGNDQWGNITAGIDLIRRTSSKATNQPFGLTVPLLTTSTGEKFGKSAGNAVFIDPQATTPFEMYQYFMHTTDEDVGKYLKMFTLLPVEHIEKAILSHTKNSKERLAQKLLAREVVDLVHGVGKGQDAETVSEVLFGSRKLQLAAVELIRIFREANILATCSRTLSLEQLIVDLTGCSKSEARRKVTQGSIYVGPERVKVVRNTDNLEQFYIDDQVLVLRVGKQKCFVAEVM
ncbi:LANO_0E08042g1_1 [Lachancea nothofagi CBS 11611]|uniref:Tyrosine--tRNA ligase n=1 Tax=Lachancea nothofagi CBS 11611 TaxID=1266666 RepID=A0A1G4JV50_9SACH|nr:LANO_0E08042g1_1 [Lachancea nothofagi CBS 11611]